MMCTDHCACAVQTRLKSVKSIQKITKSMKMVSAAKFSRAEKALQETKPLGAASIGECHDSPVMNF